MRLYSDEDEERIRAQTLVREGTRSGLLDASQCARLETELRVDVRRTNVFLRAGLALFTAFIVLATMLLINAVLGLHDRPAYAVLSAIAALVCIVLADVLAGRFRFYRFGVEEALAVVAVLLAAFSAAEWLAQPPYGWFAAASRIAALLIGTAGGFVVYRRFGFVYAAIASMACAAAIPVQTSLPGAAQHLLAAAVLAAAFAVARSKRLQHRDDYLSEEYGALQTAAFAGVYLVLNLQLGWDRIDGVFYWFTYVMTWALPLAGLCLGLPKKDRALIDVSVAMAVVTMFTNKPYLGWPRQPWDPILFGLFLIALVIALRRWFAAAPSGARHGFTSERLVGKDSPVLPLVSLGQPVPQAGPDTPGFGGGRSGGGGAGASY